MKKSTAQKNDKPALTEFQTELAHMAALIAGGYATRTGVARMQYPEIASESVMLATEIIAFVKKAVPQ